LIDATTLARAAMNRPARIPPVGCCVLSACVARVRTAPPMPVTTRKQSQTGKIVVPFRHAAST
jgi:hypothetical protein